MKVLYVGPYRDGTGWAHAAIENILALDAGEVDVVPRAFKLNDVDGEIPDRIKELEKKSDKDCNIVIQNCLPHHTDYNGSFDKNIAYYFTETSHFKNATWAERLNLLDEGWVPCNSVKFASENSYVKIPIKVVPVPCDITKYQKKYEKLNIPHLNDRFVFYTIGEVNRRKNLVDMLKAFHLEFGPNEPVELVIKGNIPGVSPAETDKHIGEICNTVKDQLKLYKNKETYLKETIITQRLSEEQVMQLHATCDCYVSASYGEGWNMPAFDAMAMGKTPICTSQGGPADFLETRRYVPDYVMIIDSGGWLVEGNTTPVFGMKDGTFADIYVGNEDWVAISISKLRKAMREAYENNEERKKRSEFGINHAYNFTYDKVGNLMRNLLDGKA